MTLRAPPRIISAVREPGYRHLKRVAVYDTLRIRFSHDEDCDNYDVMAFEDFKGNPWPEGAELLHSIMQAHKITMKEIIEDAPKTEDA